MAGSPLATALPGGVWRQPSWPRGPRWTRSRVGLDPEPKNDRADHCRPGSRPRFPGRQRPARMLSPGARDDPRASELARRLVQRQWPDGGWNCDIRPGADYSSFHETLAPLRALLEHREHPKAADRAAEFLLRHRLFRSER